MSTKLFKAYLIQSFTNFIGTYAKAGASPRPTHNRYLRRGIFRKRNADFADTAVDVDFVCAASPYCAVGQALALQGCRTDAFIKLYAVIVYTSNKIEICCTDAHIQVTVAR